MIKILSLIIIISSFSFSKKNELKPNIIFYLADDQDQIDYGIYGNNLVKTPAVDKLANEGIKFNNAYTTQAICAPSRSQIFTGLYPLKNGCMVNHISVKNNLKDVNDFMEEIGYEVILAGKSHVKPNSVFNWSYYFKNIGKFLPIEMIESYISNSKKPFCMFVTSDFPHGPFPKNTNYSDEMIFEVPYEKKHPMYNKKGYYQNIENDNDQLQTILDIVDKYNIKKNTMFIYASDHGLRGKYRVGEAGLKVPLVIRWPDIIKPNTINNGLINLVDILPTLLDIINNEVPSQLDGISFKNVLTDGTESKRKFTYGVSTWQNVRDAKVFPSRSVRDSKFKLIVNFNSKEVYKNNLGDNQYVNEFIKLGANAFPNIPYEELYDLENDPYELNNLIKDSVYNSQSESLRIELRRWMKSQNDFLITNKMPLLKPTLHPLDKDTQWTSVTKRLRNTIKDSDYLDLHY